MNKEKIKIGILGCGRVCEHYIQKILVPERVGNLFEVIAVCDIDIRKSTYVDTIKNDRILENKIGLSPVPKYPYSFQIDEKDQQ